MALLAGAGFAGATAFGVVNAATAPSGNQSNGEVISYGSTK
ncbi:hypothetical protein [Nocardioides sp. SR21]|nr:hypothetical protein [Nocardioides sp. SR21]